MNLNVFYALFVQPALAMTTAAVVTVGAGAVALQTHPTTYAVVRADNSLDTNAPEEAVSRALSAGAAISNDIAAQLPIPQIGGGTNASEQVGLPGGAAASINTSSELDVR